MSILPTTCPHCGLQDAGFIIFGARLRPQEKSKKDHRGFSLIDVSIGASCPRCHDAISGVVTNKNIMTDINGNIHNLVSEPTSVESIGFRLVEIWPKPPEPRIPQHLPDGTERALLQAERAFQRRDTDAAGMMYRRALETAIKVKFPQATGSLYQRIQSLVTSHDLPPAIGEWAHEVRTIGNEAAHDEETLSEADMIAMREFTDAVLRYAVSLPAEIAARRAATQQPAGQP